VGNVHWIIVAKRKKFQSHLFLQFSIQDSGAEGLARAPVLVLRAEKIEFLKK
jgi:hypothetical protein